jgi:hypothetical protein
MDRVEAKKKRREKQRRGILRRVYSHDAGKDVGQSICVRRLLEFASCGHEASGQDS